jgi:hypothetical protein
MRAGPLSPYVNADAPKRAAAPSLHEPATGAVTRVRASVCVGGPGERAIYPRAPPSQCRSSYSRHSGLGRPRLEDRQSLPTEQAQGGRPRHRYGRPPLIRYGEAAVGFDVPPFFSYASTARFRSRYSEHGRKHSESSVCR